MAAERGHVTTDLEGVIDMRSRAVAAASVVFLLWAAACNGETAQETDAGPATPTETSTGAPPNEIRAEDFSPDLFTEDSANIDNPWWPLAPGSRFVWEGRAFEEGERVERRVVFTVTDLTKVIAGVRTRVGWDRDFNDDKLGESELIFLAQDKYGNVWHLGQYREVYEDEFVGGRVWVVGDPKGAEAGILMKAEPKVGSPSYSQGFAPPPWDWDDVARVDQIGVRTCVPVGCYEDVLVIDEFEPTVPEAHQLKFYAPGVGNIRVGWRGVGEEEREVMVLTEFVQLSGDALVKVRARALELEHRAYAYARLPRAEPTPVEE
jgi:hypothetical protein